ncbi:unnamed protein product [Linum tenue]|uniref:Ubiquitin-like domain-containing protein n=1 Tax=Linum tenue TaxID=586396 RepID=A0AAV0PJI6_9ROSI|nr:unnamed protein product [Linum tenue]
MVEIVEEEDGGAPRSSRTGEFVNGGVEKKRTKEVNMVEITLKTIGPSPSSRLHIPSPVTVRDLRKLIAEDKNLPVENLRVVLHGKMVEDGGDDDRLVRLKDNDMLLAGLFSLSAKVWAVIILWFILAPVANRWHLGPLYILGTGFAIIFLNLGRRQAGDVSAYSIFNEDFRELPGTLNADRLDRDIRAGQM